MDLAKYGNAAFQQDQLLPLWWYQPFQFGPNVSTGIQPSWFMKGLNRSIVTREQNPKEFTRFQDLSLRAARMYDDWISALVTDAGADARGSAFELACNIGYMLYRLKEHGVERCVGIDQAELSVQRGIVNGITGIHSIDFRDGRWNPERHEIKGLLPDETFDLVVCCAFMLHISDPLHLLAELARRTKRALLINTHVGYFNFGCQIHYEPAVHHKKWGDRFPNTFDTKVSRKLLVHGLQECGFKSVRQLPYSSHWLPRRWYYSQATLVCVK
jgi:SAM-dependent methyltransferase